MNLNRIVHKVLKAPRAISRGIQEALDSWMEMAPYNISVLAQSFGSSTVTGFGGKSFDSEKGAVSDFRRREMLTWHFLASDRAYFGRFSTSAGLKWISLGELYLENGNPGNALRYSLKGLQIVEGDRDENPEDRILFDARSRVARILLKLRKHQEVLAVLDKLTGTLLAKEQYDEQFFKLSLELAGCQALSGVHGEAALVLNRLIEALERDGISTEDTTVRAYKELALVSGELGDEQKVDLYSGLAGALEWLAIMEKSTGRESRTLLDELKVLESLFLKAGKLDLSAEANYRISIIHAKARVDGPDYSGIVCDLESLALYYEKRDEGGDKTQAFHLRSRIKRIKDKDAAG